jgi:multidrug efflux pump subunit AcrB
MTLIPTLVGRRGVAKSKAPSRRVSLERLGERYGQMVAWLLGHRAAALAVAGLLAISGFALTRFVGTGFLPEMDEGGFILDYWAPAGTALSETNRQIGVLERILLRDPDIQAFTRRTGSELGFAATAPNTGDFTVLLKARRRRSASVYEVIDRVRTSAEAEAPAVRVEFVQLLQDVIGDLAGSPEPVELKLFSSDHAAAERAAMSIARAIEPTPGLVDLFNGVQGSSPELRMQLDPVRLARLGLTATEVEAQARSALFGANAGMAREPDRLIPIRVRLPDSVRFSRDLTAQVPVIGPSGWTQLGALGSVFDTAGASELRRENLRPYVPVTGRTSGRSLGAVMADVRAEAARVPLPAGVTMEVGGQYASQRTAFRQLLGIFALGTGAVLLVLVAQFDGFKGPLSIVLVAPLGLVGTLLLLLAAGVPFNVSSFMGIILLVGLVVKNGILLLDAARRTRAGGASYHGALVEAGRLRLRPILMTTLCTLAGLAPLAFGFGAGAELQRPLALAVVGGLTISTGVTLLLLPVVLDALGALGPHSNRAESVA